MDQIIYEGNNIFLLRQQLAFKMKIYANLFALSSQIILIKYSFEISFNQEKLYLINFQKFQMQSQASAIHMRTIRSPSVAEKAKQEVGVAGCEKGDLELAVDNIAKISNRYDDKNEQVSFNVDVQYFKRYGTGIYLFFHLAKRLAILFSIFALISIVPLIVNKVNGDAFSPMIKTFGIYFAQTTLANLNSNPTNETTLTLEESRRYKLYTAIPDLTICFAFLIFYIYWEVKSDKLTEEIKEQIKFQCHYTVEVTEFPSGTTEEDLQIFFNQFGKVKEVATVQNYSQLIDYSKDIYELQQKKKELSINLQTIEEQNEKRGMQNKIVACCDQITEIENKFVLMKEERALSALKYYVVYQDIYSRELALKTLKSYDKWFKWGVSHIPEKYLLRGQKLRVVACHNEPDDIIWQNQHLKWYSRLLRTIVQIILIMIVVSCTFLAISLLNIAAPSTSTYLDVSHYNKNNIMNVTNSTILYVWCINNKALMNYQPPINSLCKSYITRYYTSIVIGLLISCVVVGIKFVLRKIVAELAKFQRHKGQTEQSIAIMRALFYTYVCTTTLITVLLQAKIFGISFKDFIQKVISNSYLKENGSLLLQFHDFSPFWYVDIGYKINITMIIMALYKPLVTPLILLFKEKFRLWRASSQVTQKSMQKIMTPDAFDIEDHYANILLIMFMACSFSTGMPLIMISCAAAFVLRYFFFKLAFIRFNHIPNPLDEALNESVINTFPFILVFHFLFGIWMLSTRSIFKGQQTFVSKMLTSQHNFSQNVGAILMRLGETWYFTVSLAICVAIIILKIVFYDLIYQNYKARSGEKMSTQKLKQLKVQTQQIKVKPNGVEQKCLSYSYKIENNPKYFEILAIMNKLKKPINSN